MDLSRQETTRNRRDMHELARSVLKIAVPVSNGCWANRFWHSILRLGSVHLRHLAIDCGLLRFTCPFEKAQQNSEGEEVCR
jgi:hypothetical protein